MRPDSDLFTVAAMMNVQLNVALLIANVVVANAQYRRPRPNRPRKDLYEPWLNNPNTRSTNLKQRRLQVAPDGSRKVSF